MSVHTPPLHATASASRTVSLSALAASQQLDTGFWQRYLAAWVQTLEASQGLLLEKDPDQQVWRAIMKHPQRGQDLAQFAQVLLQQTEQTQAKAQATQTTLSDGARLRTLPLVVGPSGHREGAVLALWLPNHTSPPDLESAVESLLQALPEQVLRRDTTRASEQVRLTHGALMALTHDVCLQDRFLKAAFHLCNVLVTELAVERVSLGVLQTGRIRLIAVSQSAEFDRRSAIAQDMTDAMEEACDQERPVAYPDEEQGRVVSRAHMRFAQAHGNRSVLSVPFQGRTQQLGVVFVEHSGDSIGSEDRRRLQRVLDALGPFLERMQTADRFFVSRWAHAALVGARQLFGPRQIALKLGGLAAVLALVAVSLIQMEHRVDVKATLRSEDLSVISAPFDGFLASVHTELGQRVQPGQTLVNLDKRELLQEQALASADVVRYRREVEKARAARELAAMRIASAQQAQAQAKLALVEFKLANATVTAPREGVIVEGDLRQDLGSPVRQGDPLFKVAGTETLYVELAIDQDVVTLIKAGDVGQAALAGRPDQKFNITIERIDPVAEARDGSNVFLAKARIEDEYASWWRPGMGGSAMVDAGERPIVWIMTRRTINFLREFFWL